MGKDFNTELIKNPESGNKRAVEIYEKLVKNSNGNLDKYVNEDVLDIENSSLEKYAKEFQEFLDIVSQLYAIQKSEILIDKLEDISKNKNCMLFLRWLNGYAESASYVIKETLFIREMDVCQFEKMAEFCMTNFVLQNAGEYAEQNDWDKEQLRILKNVIYTAADLRIATNLSNKYVQKIMYEKLYLKAKYSEIILRLIEQNYEQMWRIIIIKRQKSIDEKLDQILRKYQ